MNIKNLVTGLASSALVGVGIYLCIYGLKATSLLSFIPFVNDFVLGLTQSQVMMIAILSSVIYFSFNCFSHTATAVIAAVCLFVLIFKIRDIAPALLEPFRMLFAG